MLRHLEDCFYQQRSAPADEFYCSRHILSSSSHDTIACGNNSSDSYILYKGQHLPLSLLLYFDLFSLILVSCRQMISTIADYKKILLV